MPKSNSFWDHPLTTLEEAIGLRKQIEALQKQLSNIVGGVTEPVIAKIKGGKRPMSAAARAKIAAAQRARWAKSKGATVGKKVAKAVKAAAKPAKKKGKLTAEGRARLAAAMKARWAAAKKSGTAPNAKA